MQKASFFTAVLLDCSFRHTKLLIQSLHVDWSSLKQDENSTGQDSNLKAHTDFFEFFAIYRT